MDVFGLPLHPLVVHAVVVLLPLAALGVFLATFDPNAYKPQIIAAARNATGRELRLSGPIQVKPSLVPTITVEDAGFANAPWLLGTAELIEPDGGRCALATLHAQVQNQGDAWTVISAYLDRFVEERRFLQDADGEEQTPLRQMAQTGKRLAELHLALASNSTDPDFAPEPIQQRDWQRWQQVARATGARAE